MSMFHRATAPRRVAGLRKRFAARGVALPETISEAFSDIDRIRELDPGRYPDALPVVDAYAEPDATRESIAQVAVRFTINKTLRDSWNEAVTRANLRALAEVAASTDVLVEELRPSAEAAIAEITWWAKAGSPSAEKLLQDGKVRDAKRAASIMQAFAEWRDLRDLRNKLSGRPLGWGTGGSWANAAELDQPSAIQTNAELDDVAAIVRDGGELWWPTSAQAASADTAIKQRNLEDLRATQDREPADIGDFA